MESASATSGLGNIVDTYYFTFNDVVRSFALVTTKAKAAKYAAIWWESFPECTNGRLFVALPEGFEMPRLGPSSTKSKRCDLVSSDAWDVEGRRGLGSELLRFGATNLMLLAAANPPVRARFDRLKLRYASKTIDTPKLWLEFLASFRQYDADP
jgi:hypothetical protein